MTAVAVPSVRTARHGWWWKALLVGIALWVLTTVVTIVTRNSNLIPTLILLGSFLVPFCVVLFVAERITGNMTAIQVVLAFFVSGVFGVLGASLLEADLRASTLTYVFVGFIEEFVKGVVLVVIGRSVVPKTGRQGRSWAPPWEPASRRSSRPATPSTPGSRPAASTSSRSCTPRSCGRCSPRSATCCGPPCWVRPSSAHPEPAPGTG
ncbi:hypothetical protein GCM10025866_06810 [Naasia aerilata]|uniref:PrsW family intramembrane metalloprotease n=1 Tax=Naasia aerilata TaxID=1162966 RepID=A0ABM8G9E6_9MICO|nr:hypothetical protein GCM10025866_06810 [Naasia aerilata]